MKTDLPTEQADLTDLRLADFFAQNRRNLSRICGRFSKSDYHRIISLSRFTSLFTIGTLTVISLKSDPFGVA